MARFWLLLRNEVKLARTALPIHLIAILQPAIMYLLFSLVMVRPTLDMHVVQPTSPAGRALLAAMAQVGAPQGAPYIRPLLVPASQTRDWPQVIRIEERNGRPIAVQRFGLVDSNLVKNMRNRLTAAALVLWNASLDGRAVTLAQRPWLPRDAPYTVYFGLAMLPLAAFLAAVFMGGALSAQDFELGTITEYRLAPIAPALVLAARVARLALAGLLAAGLLALVAGWRTGWWPAAPGQVALILLPMALIGGGVGISAGLLLRRSLPTLLVGLLTSLGGWILGSAFGLAAGFSGLYGQISALTPNTHAVALLFPHYYGAQVGEPRLSVLVLALYSLAALALAALVYRWRGRGHA